MPIMTPPFRISYPKIFKPELNKLSKKEEYSLEALFPMDADLSKLKAAAQEALEKKWGANKAKWPKNLKSPFKNQGDKLKTDPESGREYLPEPYQDGCIYLTLRSTQKPGVVDENVQPIMDPSKIYAGCWMRATVSVYAYDAGGNFGVNFGLTNLQFVKDGEPLGGRTKPEDDFAPVQTEAAGGSAADLYS